MHTIRIKIMHQTLPSGFTLFEFLVAFVIVVLGSTWAIPQYQRQYALNQLDQYSQQIESGLFSLRARQSAEGTSCEINVNPAYVGVTNANIGFGTAREVLELNHLHLKDRAERLRCCDATMCSWDPPYRLISKEGTKPSKSVGIKISQKTYMLSPPGMSVGSDSLIILIRSNNEHNKSTTTLPIHCVELSTAGHLHRGKWEDSRCRRP